MTDATLLHGDAREVLAGRYHTIVADPPWEYRDKLHGPFERGASSKYPCLTLDRIKALPIGEWAESNAHLYLWTTNAFLVEAHDVAVAWGFRQRTMLTWVKTQIGLGHFFRNSTEHVLFCVRGKLGVLRHDVPTHFIAARRRHSEKPQVFYDLVESVSPGPYLDIFNRRQRLGWDAWGDEAYTPTGLPEPTRLEATQPGMVGV